jgi:hypothetical protein
LFVFHEWRNINLNVRDFLNSYLWYIWYRILKYDFFGWFVTSKQFWNLIKASHTNYIPHSRFVSIHQIEITINIFLENSGILRHMLGVLSMLGKWCVGCFQINMEEFVGLCNVISLKFERVDEVSCIPICIWLMSSKLIL